MKSLRYKSFIGIVALTAMVGCGSGTTSSDTSSATTTVSVSTLADLPSATGAVTSGATTSVNKGVAKLGASDTSMPFGSITSTDFDSTMSLAACEMFNLSKTAINEAAQGDLIQCYVTSTFDAFASTNGIDLFDEQFHIFALNFDGADSNGSGENDGGPDKIKVKAKKDANGNIVYFEMFACKDNAQEMYLLQTISGTDFSMTTVFLGSEGTNTYSDKATVTGTLNSSGDFVDMVSALSTPKVIHMQHVFGNTANGDDFWGDLTFNQSASGATLTGTMSGSNTFNSETCTFTDNVAGSVSLVEGNASGTTDYQIGLLGLGDGAVKASFTGGCGSSDTWEETETEAWTAADGMALSNAAASDYYEDVAAVTLTAKEEPTIALTADQTWAACGTATAEATVVFAELEAAAATGASPLASCSNLELNHDHIDCWHIMGANYEEVAVESCRENMQTGTYVVTETTCIENVAAGDTWTVASGDDNVCVGTKDSLTLTWPSGGDDAFTMSAGGGGTFVESTNAVEFALGGEGPCDVTLALQE